MAGTKTNELRELISPFLRRKITEAEEKYGTESMLHQSLIRQYVKDPSEFVLRKGERRRHYESEVTITFEKRPVIGVERLYRRTILIEPTTVCAAHCRWCLRGQYPVQTMTGEDITHSTRYIGSSELRDDVTEILITGGDPLMSQPLLALTLSELQRNAPNIDTVRIGSRLPFQDPVRINESLMSIFHRYPNYRFEVGVNVNHPIEFWPESVEAIRRLRGEGILVYNQHPLLKGVNDDFQTLVDLYGLLRINNIEAHYLFHAIPLRGMSHHRTSLAKGLKLATMISSCGEFSGRAKPHYAVLSDIGKIVLYEGVIIGHRPSDNSLLLQSGFRIEDRRRWVPGWKVPDNAEVGEDGLMRTWYMDGKDEIVDADGQSRTQTDPSDTDKIDGWFDFKLVQH